MQFGIFYEHQLPRPWQPDSEARLIRDALVLIQRGHNPGTNPQSASGDERLNYRTFQRARPDSNGGPAGSKPDALSS
jgi:hypothetical protein